jgi:hypothetical protein
MDSLGEAFIFGTDNPAEWLESLGFNFIETISAGEYLKEEDAVLNTYLFAVAKR